MSSAERWCSRRCPGVAESDFAFTPVPFDRPLYVLFTSGSTGLPKPIVHGHGGIMLEYLKMLALQHDLDDEDTFFWFTTTSWMMWNCLVFGLLVGSTIVLCDGDPTHPDLGDLWQLTGRTGTTVVGLGAPFIARCHTEDLALPKDVDLSRVRQVDTTGAPLPVAGFE